MPIQRAMKHHQVGGIDMTIANKSVCLATATQHSTRKVGGGRCGTVYGLTLQDFGRRFGNPHDTGDGDKVHAEWYFSTPRGLVSVYDYWWNPKDQLSIGLRNTTKTDPFGNHNASMWLARFLREMGIRAIGQGNSK